MAQQDLVLGAADNDGNGEGLRDGMVKVQSNITELYSVNGWAYYRDIETTPATQVFNSTPVQLQIDGAHANSTSAYLPHEIRGSGELWDVVNDKITPINIGDGYDIRIDLEIISTTDNPTRFNITLDIGSTPDGAGGAGSIIIVSDSQTLRTGGNQDHTISFPLFSLSTFNANGGTFWISADSGTITVGRRAISIHRHSSGLL